MKRGYMDWNKELLPQSALDQRRQTLREEAGKAGVRAVVVYGDVYSADELSYYVNYAPYWCNSAAVITADDVYMVTGHNNRVNPWINELTGIEQEKLFASGFKVPVRTAMSLKERFPDGGRIGIVGKYVMNDIAEALKEEGFEIVVMDDAEEELTRKRDESYKKTAAKAARILREAFKAGEADYAVGGTSKTVAAEIEYEARKNGAMDIAVYVSHDKNAYGLPVPSEDKGGKWNVYASMQYLGVWVSMEKTFGIDCTVVEAERNKAAEAFIPGTKAVYTCGAYKICARKAVSDAAGVLNKNACDVAEGQILSLTVYDMEKDICSSDMYYITEKGAILL